MPKVHLKIRKRSLLSTIEGEITAEAETVDQVIKLCKEAKLHIQ